MISNRRLQRLWAVPILCGLWACSDTFPAAPICQGELALSVATKGRAEALTSLFENGTTEIQYSYAQALGDGRGITAGRAGFTSATGDLLAVVEGYTQQVPTSPLAAYLPRLQELAATESGATDGLEGLEAAWAAAADDPAFRSAQDAMVDALYYQPALANAGGVGLCLPLSVAVIYDSIIQHGEGDDPDGLDALIERTNEREGGNVSDGVDEGVWLRSFLELRREDLAHAFDPDTREVWADSVGRCDVWRSIADDENWFLDGPISIRTGGYDETVP